MGIHYYPKDDGTIVVGGGTVTLSNSQFGSNDDGRLAYRTSDGTSTAWPMRPAGAGHAYVWHYHPNHNPNLLPHPSEMRVMSINEKIAAERREKRERERVEALWDGYDSANFTYLNDGTVIAFEWSPEDSSKSYSYAAILVHGRWYATGDLAPRSADPETFIAWLIDKNINVGAIEIIRER